MGTAGSGKSTLTDGQNHTLRMVNYILDVQKILSTLMRPRRRFHQQVSINTIKRTP